MYYSGFQFMVFTDLFVVHKGSKMMTRDWQTKVKSTQFMQDLLGEFEKLVEAVRYMV